MIVFFDGNRDTFAVKCDECSATSNHERGGTNEMADMLTALQQYEWLISMRRDLCPGCRYREYGGQATRATASRNT